MEKYSASTIHYLVNSWFYLSGRPNSGLDLPPDEDVISTQNLAKYLKKVEKLQSHLTDMGFKHSLKYVKSIVDNLSTNKYTYEEYSKDLDILNDRIIDELEDIFFLFIPSERAAYFNNKSLFGQEVAAKFPNANREFQEAGNCYATENYTACVFHLMRSLEYGLRALARNLRVSFRRGRKIVPIDLQHWGNIINEIESKIDELNKLPRSRHKTRSLQFYSEVAKEFRYFKDAWRNHVMHTQAEYNQRDADRVIEHVRDFMQHIATKLKE